MEIVVPDPSLVVLVGTAGSGKSTFARRHFAPTEILSSDAFRAGVSGSEADQAASAAAFSLLHRALEGRLAAGLLTVVDATNVRAYARQALLRRARRAGVPAMAIVLDLPPALALARNAARTARIVGEAVIRLQQADLERSLRAGVLAAEGFAAVHRIRSAAELDAARIVRLRAARPPAAG